MALEVPQRKGMPFGIKLFRVSMVFILMDGISIFWLDSQIDSSKKSLHMYSNFFFFCKYSLCGGRWVQTSVVERLVMISAHSFLDFIVLS